MPLVRSVAAIVHPVALHPLRDASIVLARELVLVAPALASVWLVRSVQTVRQPVAETSLQYTLAVTARELVFQGTS